MLAVAHRQLLVDVVIMQPHGSGFCRLGMLAGRPRPRLTTPTYASPLFSTALSPLPQTIVQRMGVEMDRFQRERAQEMGCAGCPALLCMSWPAQLSAALGSGTAGCQAATAATSTRGHGHVQPTLPTPRTAAL